MGGVKSLQTVENALHVLEAIGERQPVGVATLARELSLDKSAVQRILVTLHQLGWIHPDGTTPGRWELGSKPLYLARRTLGARLVERAQPLLERLRTDSGETVMLAAFEEGQILVLTGLESPKALRTGVRIGQSWPLPTSASGKAVLAQLPANHRERLLGQPATAESHAELATIRRHGYATSVGEVDEGVNTVAACLADGEGRPLGALVVAAPASRLPRSKKAVLSINR